MEKSDKYLSLLESGITLPDHVAIIPDGNRRWARARGKYTFFGHKAGFDLAPKLLRFARRLGIHTMTLWAFSTENWGRALKEVKYLMKLYESMFDQHLKEAHEDKVRIIHLGRKDRIPKSLLKKIVKAEKETGGYEKFILNIALDYGGHDEINRAIGKMVEGMAGERNIGASSATHQLTQNEGGRPWEKVIDKYRGKYPIYGLANYLDTASQPYPFPDLMIRTSGEHRTSGLLTWQSAYTEYYFSDVHFPGFDLERFSAALLEFSRRRRRFGGNDAGAHLKFNPKKVAKWEVAARKAWLENEKGKVEKWMKKSLRELYGNANGLTDQATKSWIKAVDNLNLGNYTESKQAMRFYFDQIKEMTGFSFESERLADLEVDLMSLLSSDSVDRAIANGLVTETVSELFRINRLQSSKAAHLRILALEELVRAAESGNEERWALGEDYLVRSYRALREMVA